MLITFRCSAAQPFAGKKCEILKVNIAIVVKVKSGVGMVCITADFGNWGTVFIGPHICNRRDTVTGVGDIWVIPVSQITV